MSNLIAHPLMNLTQRHRGHRGDTEGRVPSVSPLCPLCLCVLSFPQSRSQSLLRETNRGEQRLRFVLRLLELLLGIRVVDDPGPRARDDALPALDEGADGDARVEPSRLRAGGEVDVADRARVETAR